MLESRGLVITRRSGETIVLGDPRNPIATIEVAEIRAESSVRLRVSGLPHIDVHRGEVAKQINDQEPPAGAPAR